MEVLDWARVEVGTFCCLNREIAPTGSLLLGEFAAITADRLMQRPLTWTSLASTATSGRLFDRLDRALTGDSLNANKTILTNWGSSMSMLVGPLQFGGLPRDHSC